MTSGGFDLFKQLAAAHPGHAGIQAHLCGALRSLTLNDANKVRDLRDCGPIEEYFH